MQRPAVEIAEKVFTFLGQLRKKSSRPPAVAAVRSGTNKGELDPVTRHPGDESAKLRRIFFRCEIAAATP